MAKSKAIYAEDQDGKLFVMAKAIMDPLCAMFDGLPYAIFSRRKDIYLHIDVAIDWCKRELQYDSKYKGIIEILEKSKADHADSKQPKAG